MTYVIALSNQKGGVGKTTNNVMFAITLATVFHKKVLHIDNTPLISILLLQI